jgi:hypothetical protein
MSFPWRPRRVRHQTRPFAVRPRTFSLGVEGLEERTLLTFGFPITSSLGAPTHSIAVGDFFTNSTTPDLVAVDPGNTTGDPGHVSLFPGNGASGFGSSVVIESGGNPVAAAVADFNGDGNLDVAIIHQNGTLSVYVGNGGGGFSPAPGSPYIVGTNPEGLVVGDFNGDGKPDIAVANEGTSTVPGNVTVLLGTGTGAFTPAPGSPFAAGPDPVALAVGDFNGDGTSDLAVANDTTAGTVTILLGTGTGSFTLGPQASIPAGTNPQDVKAAEFDGDGNTDLAVADANGVSVLLGNGDGTFQGPVTYAAGLSPQSIAVADLNGDGSPDVVVPDSNGSTISILLNNGDGTFQLATTLGVGAGPVSVLVTDMSGEHLPDLVVGNSSDQSVSVLLNLGSTQNNNERFISQVYRDLLQRPPDPMGLSSWEQYLDQGGAASNMVTAIVNSPEYRVHLIDQLYGLYLNRAVDSSGLSNFLSQLNRGVTDESVAAQLAGSPEYFATRGDSTNQGFLQALYQDVLDRPIDPTGQNYFLQQLASGISRQQVATELLTSLEYQQDLVQGDYQLLLGRAADSTGLTSFVNELQRGGTSEAILVALAGSGEFYTNVVTNSQSAFVSQVYEDVLGRSADSAGLSFWTQQLAGGATPTAVATAFLSSQEYFAQEVQSLYSLYLQRSADASGLNTFVTELSSGASDEQVAAQLAGSTEYFETRGGGTNLSFLQALYQDLLNRPLDPSGQSTFLQQLASGVSRQQVAMELLSSTEYRQDLVTNLFAEFLRRPVDSTGLSSFVAALQQGATDEQIIADLIGSPEYFARV